MGLYGRCVQSVLRVAKYCASVSVPAPKVSRTLRTDRGCMDHRFFRDNLEQRGAAHPSAFGIGTPNLSIRIMPF